MTSPAAIFRASYSDWKLIRTRKCVQLVFEVPLEESNKAYEALGGMPNSGEEAWVAIARLNPETVKEVMPDTGVQSPQPDDTSPASGPDIPARARKPVDPEKRLAQRAGILCSDLEFWKFLSKELDAKIDNEEKAAAVVRLYCKVNSRSNIKPGTEAGYLFDRLYSRFVVCRDADKYVEASA
jgi:hypothetical protein